MDDEACPDPRGADQALHFLHVRERIAMGLQPSNAGQDGISLLRRDLQMLDHDPANQVRQTTVRVIRKQGVRLACDRVRKRNSRLGGKRRHAGQGQGRVRPRRWEVGEVFDPVDAPSG